MTENKFKVGDEIIGLYQPDPYGITHEGWKGRVLNIIDEHSIEVWGLKDSEGPFRVNCKFFGLLSEHQSSELNPFKVGDLVVGTHKDAYVITNKGWQGRVVKVHDELNISVQDLDPKYPQKHIVSSKFFEHIIPDSHPPTPEKPEYLNTAEYAKEATRRGFVNGARYKALTFIGTPGQEFIFDESALWVSDGHDTFGKMGLGWIYMGGKWAKIIEPYEESVTELIGSLEDYCKNLLT